jgi:hypothetical protein
MSNEPTPTDRELKRIYEGAMLARSKRGDPDHTYVSDVTNAARRAIYERGRADAIAQFRAEVAGVVDWWREEARQPETRKLVGELDKLLAAQPSGAGVVGAELARRLLAAAKYWENRHANCENAWHPDDDQHDDAMREAEKALLPAPGQTDEGTK